jgi:phage tail sheath protein FI
MVRIGKVFVLTVLCVLVSGILFSSQVADEQVVNGSITSFSEYMTGGKTADSVLFEMAAAGHEYQPDGIYGAEFGTAGFLGETERGPETPQLVTSFEEYARIYGSHPGRSYMPYEVKGYFDNGGRRLYIVRVISQTAQTAQAGLKSGKKNACTLRAINAGEWGNRVAVKVFQGMNSTESDPTFTLEVLCFTRDKFTSIKSAKPDPALADIIEVYNDVSLNEGSPYYYENVVNQNSVLVRMDIAEDNDGSIMPDAGDRAIWLSGGSDGDVPVLADFLGSDGLDAKASTGLKALEKITTVSTLYSPVSCQYDGLDEALIQQCEALGDRTVILDTAYDDPHPTPWSRLISSYASCYSPWIQVTGPDSKDIMVPPGGFIAGLYARNDHVKGPDKSPVNEVLVGVTGVEIQLSPQARKALSIRRINPITEIPGVGYVVDEFMTLSDLTDDYGSLNFRRYINFIKDSISTSLFWVSGQELTQDLQSTIKLSIEDFLDREWKRGALLGSTQIEAYYVKVDPQQTADREGLRPSVAIEVGVALKEPSQFFVFNIIK